VATTVTGAQLTEQHRRAQLAIRSAFMAELVRLWPLINLDRLDETAAEWIGFVTDLIMLWRNESVNRALLYYDEFRRAETGQPLTQRGNYRSLVTVEPAAIRTSLLVTGPIGVKSRIGKGIHPEVAKAKALVDVTGAASRHVLNGGRQLITEATNRDKLAVGFARVTDDDPCAFCAMLASRGPDYNSRASALRTTSRSKKRGPGREYHDHCGCTVEAVYSDDADWPGRAREFEQLWKDSTKGKGGKNALNAFRNAYEAQRRSRSQASASQQ
jgi:hypothetical protein